MAMKSELELLQDDLAARLNSLEYFSDITVKALRAYKDAAGHKAIADVQGLLDQALAGMIAKAGKVGAAVSVLMPAFDVPHPNLAGPQGTVLVCVRVQELPIVNQGASGTGKSAEAIALQVLAAGHQFRLQGICEVLKAAKNALTPSLEFAPRMTYDVLFEATLAMPVQARCRMPAATVQGLQVTLADQEGGASLYYSLDDTFPWAGSGLPYTVPFTVPAGTVVRWAAYKTGKQGSDVGRVAV